MTDPARQVPRLKERKHRYATFLDYAGFKALVEVIDHETSLQGNRDYALILTLLTTGLNAMEVRELQWRAIQ